MKTSVLLAIVVLCYAPLVVGGNDPGYPSERVADFVVERLDVTSLPSAFRPKKEKGKRTFTDYGFTAQRVDESEAIVESRGAATKLTIKVLDRGSSGIYVCVTNPGQNGSEPKTQSVVLLKRKNPNALLKGRETFREYTACPVIGRNDPTADSSSAD
jgi:hypothetical protein